MDKCIIGRMYAEYGNPIPKTQAMRELNEAKLKLVEANLKLSEERRMREVAEHKCEISEIKCKAIEENANLRVRVAQLEALL